MERFEIDTMSFGPYGIARAEGKTILVPEASPGDVVEAEIAAARRDYAIARPLRFVQAGPDRRESPCRYRPECGGCDWQQITYPAQVRIKAELLAKELRRAFDVDLDPVGLIEPASSEFAYRSRVRLKVGPDGAIGYHQLGSNRLVPIAECPVAGIELKHAASLASALGKRCEEIEAVKAGDYQVLVAILQRPPDKRDLSIAERIVDDPDSRVAGVVIRGGDRRAVIGRATITVEAEDGCVIEGEADRFSQVNPEQNRKLVAHVMALAGVGPSDVVLDLFCGAGNLSLPAARRGAVVTGVDADELAIAAARENAVRMKLKQAQFIAMAAADTAQFLQRAKYRPTVVTLDPPRTGALALMEVIAKLRPPRIIYVSCDVATLVRDLTALTKSAYRIGRVAGFDFFPNTHHVEVVAEALLT